MASERLYHDYIAGALGGSIGLAVGYPFDTTKVLSFSAPRVQAYRYRSYYPSGFIDYVTVGDMRRALTILVQLQTQLYGNQYRGFGDALRHIYKEGWIRGFYRGMSWPIISVGFTNSIFFGVYGNILKTLEPDKEKRKSAFGKILFAGCAGGAAQALPVIPIDYVKVVLQSQIKHEIKHVHLGRVVPTFQGPVDCALYICKTEGPYRLYKGAGLTLCRDIPCFGVYGLTYQFLSGSLKACGWTDNQGLTADLVGGGFAGVAAWLCVTPVDVVKSRYQADTRGQFKGYIDCAIQSYKEEGVRVFLRGSSAVCLRGFFINAVEFMVYAQVLRLLEGETSQIHHNK